jgi:hypothetical protein
MRITRFQSSSVTLCQLRSLTLIPALLTRTSIRPKSAISFSATAATAF